MQREYGMQSSPKIKSEPFDQPRHCNPAEMHSSQYLPLQLHVPMQNLTPETALRSGMEDYSQVHGCFMGTNDGTEMLVPPLSRRNTAEFFRYGEAPYEHQHLFSVTEPSPSTSQQIIHDDFYSHDMRPHDSWRGTESPDYELCNEGMEVLTPSSSSSRAELSPSTELWCQGLADLPPGFEHILDREPPDEDDASGDKPYAQLIYDALLQAPSHRMMLREIYDWFQRNTKKVHDSSSNGWQNSIRHNLSMNQACLPSGFERGEI